MTVSVSECISFFFAPRLRAFFFGRGGGGVDLSRKVPVND